MDDYKSIARERREELARLRMIVAGLEATIEESSGRRPPRMTTFALGKVYNPLAPDPIGTDVPAWFAVHPATISGPAVEAEEATVAIDTNTSNRQLYMVAHSVAPEVDDYLIASRQGGYWTSEHAIPTDPGVFIPGCPCTDIPLTLNITINHPDLAHGIFYNSTLVYQRIPDGYDALAIGTSEIDGRFGYLSTSSFPDATTGDLFRYYFSCYNGFYMLTRVYLSYIYSSPPNSAYIDVIRYRWVIGVPGNTCDPFLLSNGQVYAGGDRTIIVTIS